MGTPDLINKTILNVALTFVWNHEKFNIKKKVLWSAEKGSVIWAELNSRSSVKQFCQTKRSFGQWFIYISQGFVTVLVSHPNPNVAMTGCKGLRAKKMRIVVRWDTVIATFWVKAASKYFFFLFPCQIFKSYLIF